MNISNYIDHTLLKPTATEREILTLCNEAKKNRFKAVCVNSCYVPLASQTLFKSDVKICAVVGFPLGAMSTQAKVFEAKNAIEQGAHEIDMVINLGLLKSKNYMGVLKDISDVKNAIGHKTLKVILEISELSKNEIIKACEIAMDANADFVKTSTGFSKSGATLTAVKIMRKTVKDQLKIKASGGVNTFDKVLKYIQAGADRIGTSSGVAIINNQESTVAY